MSTPHQDISSDLITSDFNLLLDALRCELVKAARKPGDVTSCEILSTEPLEISLCFSCQREPDGPLTHWRVDIAGQWETLDELVSWLTMVRTKS